MSYLDEYKLAARLVSELVASVPSIRGEFTRGYQRACEVAVDMLKTLQEGDVMDENGVEGGDVDGRGRSKPLDVTPPAPVCRCGSAIPDANGKLHPCVCAPEAGAGVVVMPKAYTLFDISHGEWCKVDDVRAVVARVRELEAKIRELEHGK